MELSNKELMEIVKRREDKIKSQAKKIVKLQKNRLSERTESECEKLIIELRVSEHDLRTMRDEHLEEIKELRADLAFLLLEDLEISKI